jgi:hypothetical protein
MGLLASYVAMKRAQRRHAKAKRALDARQEADRIRYLGNGGDDMVAYVAGRWYAWADGEWRPAPPPSWMADETVTQVEEDARHGDRP